jgi:hypothetical protein
MNLQRLYRLSFDTPPTTPTAPVVESERRPARPLPDHYREAKP